MRSTRWKAPRRMTEVVDLCSSDEEEQHVVGIITLNSWLSTDHLTLWAELMNEHAARQRGQLGTVLFCAARPLSGLHGSIGSLGFASNSAKLFVMPFAHRSHFFLVGIRDGVVRYFLDPMSMAQRTLSAFQKASIRSIQSAVDGCTVAGASVQPQWQDAAAGDGYNCGVFCCLYMWEILHRRPWAGGGVATFRQHVGTQLDCWWQPTVGMKRRLRSSSI
ncbi:hypothetical protein COO60DRAFT_1519628 [Scenedesmus sp. NREL 46B-D3]|nr:hypothetical protein COO60DRAFT_1519628 [Scenedesmus sp. NREL 46B-D3]